VTEKKGKQAIMNPEAIRDISEAVYRRKLDAECGEGTAKQTDDDIAAGVLGPDGKPKMSIRARAAAYDKITRHYVAVIAGIRT
jgi:hypothetical protein